MPIFSNIVWCCAVTLAFMLILPSAHAQLGDDPKFLKEFECNDKHNTKLRFRCASVETDASGKKLCVGDSIILNGVPVAQPYDPCAYSTCLGVKCNDAKYKYLMQLYSTVGRNNLMIPRSSTELRCGCSAAVKENAHNPPPPLYVFPDSPESQPDDAACNIYLGSCSSNSQFAHSPNGDGEDCECCDKPTDKLCIYPPPLDAAYDGCVPIDVDPTSTNPNNAHSSSTTNSDNNNNNNNNNNSNNNSPDEFVSMVHKICSASVSVADDVLSSKAGSFCCSFATGSSASTASCGMDIVGFVGSFTISAEAQCQFNVTDHPFSCCATVGAQGNEIVNKGAICTSGSGGRGDSALRPRSIQLIVTVVIIVMLSPVWIL